MGGRPAAAIAAALWFGILAGRGAPPVFATAGSLVAVLAGLASLRAPRLVAAALLVVAALAAGAARGAIDARVMRASRAACGDGALVRIEGVVDGPGGAASDRPIVVVCVARASPPLPAGTRVRLKLPEGGDADWGDRVECLAELTRPEPPRNPGGWDGVLGAEAAGVAANGRAFTLRRTGVTAVGALLRATVVPWRRGIERTLAARLSPPARDLVIPLVTGDRAGLSTELDADFRAAGLVHLLALSGLHLSALAAVARLIVATLGGGVTARAVAGVAAALFYVGLAGPIPSLARAAAGECWLGAARAARLAADPLQSLAISAIVLLGLRPGWALDLGFQLSCAATLGLATVAPLTGALRGPARSPALPVATTIAAQVMCAPILMTRTYGLSWPAVIANLIAVPTCGLLLAAAWLGIVTDALAYGAGHFFFSACELLARALTAETTSAARWPAALVATGHEPAVAGLAAAGAVLVAWAAAAPADLESRGRRWSESREAMLGLGLLAAALALVLAASAPALRPPAGKVWLVALDVGQGDAIALGWEDGWWLVDAGPRSPQYDAGDRVVRPFFRWAAVRRLGALVLTHDDGDHTGGAGAVLAGVMVDRIVGPPARAGLPGPLVRFAATRTHAAAQGDTLHRDPPGGVADLVALWPPRGPSEVAARGDNAAGLVLALTHGRARALLMADVDSLVEREIDVTAPTAVLKLGHHGSRSSSGAGFLARARPELALVSAGARNVYGHPAREVLDRLAAVGARIARTDREGAIWLELGDGAATRVAWREARFARARPASTVVAPVAAPRAP